MKKTLLLLTLALASLHAQQKTNIGKAGDSIKDAGASTADAAKSTGAATAEGAKKVGGATAKLAKKTGKATAKGAKKVGKVTADTTVKGVNSGAKAVEKATDKK